jgi:hypothetical protein
MKVSPSAAVKKIRALDPFCAVWHLLALLADGIDGWKPQYRY